MNLAARSVVLADVTTLGLLRPDPAALAALVSAPRSSMAREGADAACVRLAGAGLWIIAAWVAIGLLAAAAAQLPGTVGHRARRVSQMVLPHVLQRVLVGSAGLGVLLAPAVAQARSHWVPAPITSPPPVNAGLNPVPGPAWPTNDPDVERPSGVPSLGAPRTLPRDTSPSPPQDPARLPSPAGHVRVHGGDALWLVAAHRLGPDASEQAIAQYWPRIFAANRAVVGDDPNLIQPGQELRLPAPTSQERS